jgi:hypothetical protein
MAAFILLASIEGIQLRALPGFGKRLLGIASKSRVYAMLLIDLVNGTESKCNLAIAALS